MSMRLICGLALVPGVVVTSVMLAGCSDWSSSRPNPAVPGITSATGANLELSTAEEAQRDTAGEVTLRVVDETEFAQALQRYRGKVVLVDAWATWCLPCLELLPHTVELHERFADRDLVVISLNFDSPGDDHEKVLEILKSKGATFDNFISRYGGGTKSFEVFDIENGALPNLKLYDRTGKLRKTFGTVTVGPEPFEPEDIDRAVEALLAES